MTRVNNKWLVPESMVVGAGSLLVAMIIPKVRDAIYKGCRKVAGWVGL